jgi:hypothetical protein
MDIDGFEDYLELRDPEVRAIIAEGHREYRAGKSRPARDLSAPTRQAPAAPNGAMRRFAVRTVPRGSS